MCEREWSGKWEHVSGVFILGGFGGYGMKMTGVLGLFYCLAIIVLFVFAVM